MGKASNSSKLNTPPPMNAIKTETTAVHRVDGDSARSRGSSVATVATVAFCHSPAGLAARSIESNTASSGVQPGTSVTTSQSATASWKTKGM
eukprot:CAMPEP_0198503356 /NCGR_PEP_ID=MMETSP1462-20131121/9850_1 /TAXON_ID=1333877 /ORGANISM="Brandtodinium nutriculum, Strain RCC3387" /LENGTH=91 /DNA_ID=CAMNT_0044232473 /DNA_START=200 /DNA_END=475 /DNA_ORIENTATION=-